MVPPALLMPPSLCESYATHVFAFYENSLPYVLYEHHLNTCVMR